MGVGCALHIAAGSPDTSRCPWKSIPTPTRSGPGPQPMGRCLTGHLCCKSLSYLGAQEPCSGGRPARGSISEAQGSRHPGHRTRWMHLAPLLGRPQVSMQTPWTDSALGNSDQRLMTLAIKTWVSCSATTPGGLLELILSAVPGGTRCGLLKGHHSMSKVLEKLPHRDWILGMKNGHVVQPREPLGQKCQHPCGATNQRFASLCFLSHRNNQQPWG